MAEFAEVHFLESASEEELATPEAPRPRTESRAVVRTALAAAVAIGLLLAVALAHLGEGVAKAAAAGHVLGLDEEEDSCKKYQRGLMQAAEHMGVIQLEGIVLRRGCAVNESSPECYEEKEKIAGFFPKCGGGPDCQVAKISLAIHAENINITQPWERRRGGKSSSPKPIFIKSVKFQMTRTHHFPSTCEKQIKKWVEGDANTGASIFNSTNFCKLNISGLPVPRLVDCKKLELRPEDGPRCNRLERFVGKKLRVWKVGFSSGCHGSFEIQE